jgi:N-acetylglucosaminyl-diphospho-decaprenol L-rhamnosyltransferase
MNSVQAPRPPVTVITVSYGSEAVLPALLDSLTDAVSDPVPVVIADNAPEDGATRALAEARNLAYVPLANPGYGGAVNAAVRECTVDTEWLLIVNPDVTFTPHAIDRLLESGRSDDAIGSVGPLIRDADGSIYPSARQLPRLLSGTGHAILGSRWPANPWTRAYRRQNEAPVPRDAEWLSGACVLVRRSAFEAVGGFDDGFFMYFEDVDLGARLLEAGYRNRYEPHAEVTHTGAHSTERSLASMTRAHHDSAYRYIVKRYRGPLNWPLRQLLRAGIAARSWVVRGRTP